MPTRDTRRTTTALHLRAAGTPWAETAERAGFTDSSAAIRAAQRELRRRERAATEELELVQELRRAVFRSGQ